MPSEPAVANDRRNYWITNVVLLLYFAVAIAFVVVVVLGLLHGFPVKL